MNQIPKVLCETINIKTNDPRCANNTINSLHICFCFNENGFLYCIDIDKLRFHYRVTSHKWTFHAPGLGLLIHLYFPRLQQQHYCVIFYAS